MQANEIESSKRNDRGILHRICQGCAPVSEMDGAELITTIGKRSTMPVLVLCYDSAIHHMERAYKSGADDFLAKPFVTEQSLLRAQALIQRFNVPMG